MFHLEGFPAQHAVGQRQQVAAAVFFDQRTHRFLALETRVRVQHQLVLRRQQHRQDGRVLRQPVEDRRQPGHGHVHADHADDAALHAVAGPAQRQVVGGEVHARRGFVLVGLAPPGRTAGDGAGVPGHHPVVVTQARHGVFEKALPLAPDVPGETRVLRAQPARLDDQHRAGDVRVRGHRGHQQLAQGHGFAAHHGGVRAQGLAADLHRVQGGLQAAGGLAGQAAHLGLGVFDQHAADGRVEHRRHAQQQQDAGQRRPEHQPRAQAAARGQGVGGSADRIHGLPGTGRDTRPGPSIAAGRGPEP